jgi:hypothetical protein
MPLFDAYSRLSMDPCAVRVRDDTNYEYAKYAMTQDKLRYDDCKRVATEDAKRLISDGHGLDPSAVDADSSFRNSRTAVTHTRVRQSLPTRVFTAAPDLGRGGLRVNTESRLLSGDDTTQMRECSARLAERDWDRFDPAICAVAVENVVQAWRGGEPSREIARSGAFLSDMGYKWDCKTRTWHR